jgi:hypothetical protein
MESNEIFGITPQTQPTSCTCAQTCLAMVINTPVADVIELYGSEPMNQQYLCHALTECGVVWNQMTNGTMVYEGWYMVVVPSLNNRGGNHQVLVRYSRDEGLCVLDPSAKIRYKQDGSDLRGWSYLTPVWLGGALPKSI